MFNYPLPLLRAIQDNEDYNAGIADLAIHLPRPFGDVDAAFKEWIKTRPYSWRDGLLYCRNRLSRGLSLPLRFDGVKIDLQKTEHRVTSSAV